MRLKIIFGSLAVVLLSVVVFSGNPVMAQTTDSSGNVVVQTIEGPTVTEKVVNRTKQSWPWYVTRASGLVAAFALVVLMLSGIGQITGQTFKFLDPLTAWASHRALGIAFGVSVLIHIFSLLFDHFVTFSFVDLFIPWLSDYKPIKLFGLSVGSLYVALGILAFYGALIIVVTSLLWVEKKPYTWKLIHLFSYLVMFFVFIHALYLGTDLLHGIFRILWILFGVFVVVASLARLRRAKTV